MKITNKEYAKLLALVPALKRAKTRPKHHGLSPLDYFFSTTQILRKKTGLPWPWS
jgi:hypothetical protein